MAQEKIAVIPAYQPQPVLIQLLAELRAKDYHIIVVDDGSGQEFGKRFRQAASYAVILTHDVNYGKGRALKTGFSYVQSHFPQDITVVTLDADGQHNVSDAEKVCYTAQGQMDTLVVGSRKIQKDTPLRSRFGNTITRYVYRLSTGVKVYDTQSGLRAFSGRLIPVLLDIPGERYEYEMNVLLACPGFGICINEIAIQTIYFNRNETSHFHTFQDSLRIYGEIIRFSASSLISFFMDYLFYSLLLLLTGMAGHANLVFANVGARMVSASVNFILNRRLVFASQGSVTVSLFKYAALAAVVLSGNTCVLKLLVEVAGVNQYLAKISTELLFFAFSFFAQRYFIFRS